jgi:hypothetical protein
VRFKHYINRILVSKQRASEAAQALFSTTAIRFGGHISKAFFPHTCLGIAELTTISLDMDDLARFAKKLTIVCPQPRQIRIHAPDVGLWVFDIAGEIALYRSKWTWDQVRGSSWFCTIRPLSGLLDASVNFRNIDFLRTSIYDVYEQDNIRTNRALVQALFRQSATRRREVPPSGKMSFSARDLLHSASKVAGSTDDANLEFEVRF